MSEDSDETWGFYESVRKNIERLREDDREVPIHYERHEHVVIHDIALDADGAALTLFEECGVDAYGEPRNAWINAFGYESFCDVGRWR